MSTSSTTPSSGRIPILYRNLDPKVVKRVYKRLFQSRVSGFDFPQKVVDLERLERFVNADDTKAVFLMAYDAHTNTQAFTDDFGINAPRFTRKRDARRFLFVWVTESTQVPFFYVPEDRPLNKAFLFLRLNADGTLGPLPSNDTAEQVADFMQARRLRY